ncbi:hypothetical protein E4T38_03653 [Aureobasidium subglaciale]|nr:hypothetical protein E4T38_03653 [Aureobasidium subglaciale]KAI5225669.1 hypothetical protein E4T40_03428 [Aureobasidium subglaciale]KAI5229132.1 hypothetical protein E4T41_03508 [Aureobasidium subglaciale]KAI5263910.1 hypothetical protein E4T46_03427 [Aureobasidium subglaciale]
MSAQGSGDAAEQGGQESAPSANKRRRIGLACNACRMRKSRCDGHRPSCSSCVSLDFECQYESSESATNVVVRKDYMTGLDQRMVNLERTVQRLNDVLKGHLSPCVDNRASSSARPPPNSFPSSQSDPDQGQTHVTGLEEPQDEDAVQENGMAMVFVEEHTSAFFGESSNINFTQLLLRAIATVRHPTTDIPSIIENLGSADEGNVASVYGQPHNGSIASATQDVSITSLPTTAEMNDLLDIYFNTSGVVFDFIHEETTRKTLAECSNNGFTKARRTWLGTLNMIFAMACMLDRDNLPSAKKRFEKSEVFYRRAIGLCGELSKHVISLEIVHYLLLVVLFCQGTQRSVQAWNNHGLLIRSAMALGLHSTVAGKNLDPIQEEYRRRTWVVIYCMDKVLSVAFGRPAGIADEQAVNRQPSSRLFRTTGMANNELDVAGDFLAVSFELYQVMSKSLVKQYATNAEYKESDPNDLLALQASVEFCKTLRIWSAGLPPYLGLCDPQSDILGENTRVNRLRVILTMRYHNLSILVHRPLLSATINHLFQKDRGALDEAPYFIQLAMAEAHECIRSAESTIDIVYAVITADPTSKNNLGVWYFTLYYVFTASLVISARLLWAQHEGIPPDLTAINHAKKLLKKAETIFQHLDYENSLVLSCWKYIHQLSLMCNFRANPNGTPASASVLPDNASNPASVTDPFVTMPLDADDLEVYQLFASEMFDPSIFEHSSCGTASWEGMMYRGYQR